MTNIKRTIGIATITAGISSLIWIFFYVLRMPLHDEDTMVVVAVVFVFTSAAKWFLGRRNEKDNKL